MKIEKGIKLKIKKAMSEKDPYKYEGYISRVFTEKCFFQFKSNNPIATEGRMTFYIEGLKNKIEKGEAIIL